MRTIHYGVILSRPYLIDCNPDIHNYDGIRDAEAVKLPGIRMIVEECKDPEKFFASFEYSCVDNFHPKFERQMLKVLHGELPEWKLTTVKVDSFTLQLGFMNETLFSKYANKCKAVETWNKTHTGYSRRFSPPPFYTESVYSYRPNVGAKLCFEVDNPVNKDTEITIVSFCQEYANRIIEFGGDRGRELTFRYEGVSLNQHPVSVKEWAI